MRTQNAAASGTRRLYILPESAGSDAGWLLLSRGLRAFGDGLVSLLLPVYLAALGFGAFEIGILATATLAGSSLLTLLIGLYAHRFSGRSLLIGAAILMALTGSAFSFAEDFWPLLLIAFAGTPERVIGRCEPLSAAGAGAAHPHCRGS